MSDNLIIETLATAHKGKAQTQLSERLREVVEAVAKTGGKGELTIKLKVASSGDGQAANFRSMTAVFLLIDGHQEASLQAPQAEVAGAQQV